MNMPEILAPGGGFNSSMHAFEAGADAVYAGMSSFSARKGAANFSIERLRRLKSYAGEKGKKIYIALNTVIRQAELEEVIKLLHQLSEIQVDGIILQDGGLAYIIRNYFPRLELHGSTQMAVHNSQGVDVLKRAGFSRIILARELTLAEMEKIRRDHRDVELEVFIHGAMCYSFSGICLASGRLLGRSGNRGECGQICRTWFDGEEKHRYAFSANDMKAGKTVMKLAEMGIDSLKIEGRLKSPEYVSHTVSYYRRLLDGEKGYDLSKEEEFSSIAFSRNQTQAFFKDPKGQSMIDNRYASHKGILAGKVLSGKKGQFSFKTSLDIAERDGLLLFLHEEPKQFAFKSATKRNKYKKGETVPVLFNHSVPAGTEVYLVSRHDMQLKEFKEESRKPWKTPLPLTIAIDKEKLTVSAKIAGQSIHYNEDLTVGVSTGKKEIRRILEESFNKSGESFYMGSAIEIVNNTGLDHDEIFIAPSVLKKIRQNFYLHIKEAAVDAHETSARAICHEIESKLEDLPYERVERDIPPRREMGPENSLIPFGPGPKGFYPLPPLLFNDIQFHKVEKTIDALLRDQNGPVILGINNISHLQFAEKYRDNERVFFFTDYCSYVANKAAALFYRERISRLLFSYYWIEDKDRPIKDLRYFEEDFEPHLFISRICYKLHNNIGTCKNCAKDYTYDLKQRDREFTVVVKECLTWLFQKR